MNELSIVAATAWANSHSARSFDPVEFGANVARVYVACQLTEHHAGDEKATAAALASLSIRPEVLQAIAQLALIGPLNSAEKSRTHSAGAGS